MTKGYAVAPYAPNGEMVGGIERHTRKSDAMKDARALVAENRFDMVAIWECEYSWVGGEPNGWQEPRYDLDPVWMWKASENMTWTARLEVRSEPELEYEIEKIRSLGYSVSVLGVKSRHFDLGYAEVYFDVLVDEAE